MKFAIYGVSRSGKNYLIEKLVRFFQEKSVSLVHVNGSGILKELAQEIYKKEFKQLNEEEKVCLRQKFIERLDVAEKEYGNIVVDGHYAFYNQSGELFKVFTESDKKAYDMFFYLETKPFEIIQRMRNSLGDKRNEEMTEAQVAVWQDYEISEMSEELLRNDKELHVLRYGEEVFEYIYEVVVLGKYNSLRIAEEMLSNIKFDLCYETIVVTDCDKTLSMEDTTNVACDIKGIDKEVFKRIYAGDRYSNYQSWLANQYISEKSLFSDNIIQEVVEKTHFNNAILADLQAKENVRIVALSAGFSKAWATLLNQVGVQTDVLTSESRVVSKYVKYFVVKLLKQQGKFVVAIGDSLLDGLMLKEADVGYIATTKGYRKNVEEFLRGNKTIRQLKYFDYQYDFLQSDEFILSAKSLTKNEEIEQKIALCKSNSNCTGKVLRVTHYELGQEVAKMIKADAEKNDFAVIIMMRSGLSFGMGVADFFDCPVLFHDDQNNVDLSAQLQENNLQDKKLILCDGVVNTGKSIYSLIKACKLMNVIIATNVLSDKVDRAKMIPIYATRISQNSFVGTKQKSVVNGKGPDTSDRLFNLL